MATNHIQRIQKAIPRTGDYFGGTVKFSYDGSTMICTAAAFDVVNYNIPTLSVYNLVDGSYVYHSDVPFPSDLALTDHAATYAQINASGDVILVSANNYINVNSPVGPNGGIFVFHLISDVWTLVNTIIAVPPNPAANHQDDKFGFQFDLADDFRTMVASAPFDDNNITSAGTDDGTVYVFETSNNWLSYTEKTQLIDPGAGGVSYFFGYNCVISGDGLNCFVSVMDGNPYALVNHYKKILGVWSYQSSRASPDSPTVNFFGSAESSIPKEFNGVAIATDRTGDILVIGDHINQNKGSFYILKRNGTSFTQIYSEVSADTGDFMGYSVAVNKNGSVVIVGVQGKDSGFAIDQGSIRVYNVDGVNVTFKEEIFAPYLQSYSYGGFKVDISPDGKYIGAGSIQDTIGAATLAGSVNVWENRRSPGPRTRNFFLLGGTVNKQ